MQNQGKENHLKFKNQIDTLVGQLEDLSIIQSDQLLKQNKNFIQSLKDNSEYSEEEVEWYQNLLQDVNQDIEN